MAVVGKQCGRVRLTSGFLSELETALHRAGIHTDRLLNARSTRQGDWVRFSATAFTPSEVEFGCEKQLVDLVVQRSGSAGWSRRGLHRRHSRRTFPASRRSGFDEAVGGIRGALFDEAQLHALGERLRELLGQPADGRQGA